MLVPIQIEIPKKLTVAQKVQGAIKKVEAQFIPETPKSRARLQICLGCDYYSENSNNAEKGRKICRLCKCPVADKVLNPSHTCALPDPLKKW